MNYIDCEPVAVGNFVDEYIFILNIPIKRETELLIFYIFHIIHILKTMRLFSKV